MLNISRRITASLSQWRTSFGRRPVIIRGARQIGKSHSIREFGRAHFENVVEVNLEERRTLAGLFESGDPKLICAELALQFNQPIQPGKTLLFLDEIQEAPAALGALRFFFEKLPELHVACAGSMLDMVLDREKNLRVPVGRVEYLYMAPCSFVEFLDALDETIAKETVQTLSLSTPPSDEAHRKLLDLFNRYVLCGGMPAVVAAYADAPESLRFRKLQADLIQTFREDLRKYKTRIDYDKLDAAFATLPRFVSQEFKFTTFNPTWSSTTTQSLLDLFSQARIINYVYSSAGNGVPLAAEVKRSPHKFTFVDVGLLCSSMGLTIEKIAGWNHDLVNPGIVTEQVVGQELLAYFDALFEPKNFAWKRDKPGANAQVDYLYVSDGVVIPLEVKSGTTGTLKSLKIFLKEKGGRFGVRVSQHNLSLHDQVLSVPVYGLSSLGRLTSEALKTS
jgi:predicted AAA+ superfamily ATPase